MKFSDTIPSMTIELENAPPTVEDATDFALYLFAYWLVEEMKRQKCFDNFPKNE